MDKFIQSNKHIFTEKILGKIDIYTVCPLVVANDKSIFVFGGDVYAPITSTAVRRYDISDNKWHNLKDMPHYLRDSTIQIVDDEIFIMGGGRKVTYTCYNLVYNTTGDYWKEKASLPISRKGLVSAIIDGIIYIAYGYFMMGVYDVPPHCYAYNPKTDTWKQRQKPPGYRGFGMSVVIDNFWYVLGGYTPDNPDGDSLKMDRYCPETDLWEAMPDMPRARMDSVAVAIDSKIFIFCGLLQSDCVFYDYTTVDYYDTRTRKWIISDIPSLPITDAQIAMIDNKIYLAFGHYFYNRDNENLYEITYEGMKE